MRKKTIIRIISFSLAAVLCLGVFVCRSIRRNRQLENYARISSQHAFEELVGSVDDLSNNLEKSLYVSDSLLQAELLTQVYGKALQAQMAMSALPYGSWQIQQASGFLSRAGDYACKLIENVYENEGFSEQELSNLQSLSETAAVTAGNLRALQGQVNNGTMTLDTELAAENTASESLMVSDAIADIENEFPQLPTLIYDGPFSDGLKKGAASMLADKADVTTEEAKTLLAAMLDLNTADIESGGSCVGDVPLLCFTAGDYSICATEKGGVLWSVLSSRTVSSAQYTAQEAQQIAEGFLKKIGIGDVKASYHIIQNNVAVFNFEYVQDSAVCYSDLIKVGIALDKGVLQSYDASDYILNHRLREIPAEILHEEEIAAKLSPALELQKVSMALIPTAGGEEIYCYELLCRGTEERNCLVYVNAQTGREEKILLLLEDENGTLTI